MTDRDSYEPVRRDIEEALDLAIATIMEGNPVPLDLSTRLLESGYDVEALQRRYYA